MDKPTKKYELPEESFGNAQESAGMVSEPVAACDYAEVQCPAMHVSHSNGFELTEEQIRDILAVSDSAAAQGKVYSHEDVMDRLINYKYGHSLV